MILSFSPYLLAYCCVCWLFHKFLVSLPHFLVFFLSYFIIIFVRLIRILPLEKLACTQKIIIINKWKFKNPDYMDGVSHWIMQESCPLSFSPVCRPIYFIKDSEYLIRSMLSRTHTHTHTRTHTRTHTHTQTNSTKTRCNFSHKESWRICTFFLFSGCWYASSSTRSIHTVLSTLSEQHCGVFDI